MLGGWTNFYHNVRISPFFHILHLTNKGMRGGWFKYAQSYYFELVLGDPIVICSAILTYNILHGHNRLRYLDFHLYFS